MTDARKTEDLDRLFSQMREDGDKAVPDDLMARVLADARQVQNRPARVPDASRPGPFAALADLLGGWRGMGGLVAASCAGLWLGIAPPAALDEMSAGLVGGSTEVALGLTLSDIGLGEFE